MCIILVPKTISRDKNLKLSINILEGKRKIKYHKRLITYKHMQRDILNDRIPISHVNSSSERFGLMKKEIKKFPPYKTNSCMIRREFQSNNYLRSVICVDKDI